MLKMREYLFVTEFCNPGAYPRKSPNVPHVARIKAARDLDATVVPNGQRAEYGT